MSLEHAVAIHLGYKSGIWYGEEKAIYARQDFRTGQSFILVLGVDKFDQGEDRVDRLLRANPEAHFLHVVHALRSYNYGTIESARYQQDYTIQEFEAADGTVELGSFSLDTAKGFKPTASPDNKKLRGTAVYIRNLSSGSARGRTMCEQFLLHLDQYAAVTGDTDHGPPDSQMKGLQEATKLLIELGRRQQEQIEELYSRAIALIDVRKVAMARHDTQINLDLAAAAKYDSELMRGIAAVTMIFLPGTFVATFFSMVFFQDGDSTLTVDRHIWLYPAIALPLTVGIIGWYLAWSSGWTWKNVLPSRGRNTAASQAASLEMYGQHAKQENRPLASTVSDFFT